jgi:hypothetical protein
VADDDWRVTVSLRDEADVERAVAALREHVVPGDASDRLGRRVALSADGLNVFVYAGTEDAAREADGIAREVMTDQRLAADFAVDRWHPIEEAWEDAGAPLPETAQQRQAEHQRLMDEETRESAAAGEPEWEVRVEMASHRDAVKLAERLRAEGRPVARRWKFLLLGASNEDDARELAAAVGREAPATARVEASAVPFTHFGPA